jgi:anaerobic magnesium-protoporphyrin IX monomethyl ester cyclase
VLKRVRKGVDLAQVEQALRWSKEAGIRNWGYFIIGLPGETEETIQEAIRFSKRLPLDLVLSSPSLWRPAVEIGLESLGWATGG